MTHQQRGCGSLLRRWSLFGQKNMRIESIPSKHHAGRFLVFPLIITKYLRTCRCPSGVLSLGPPYRTSCKSSSSSSTRWTNSTTLKERLYVVVLMSFKKVGCVAKLRLRTRGKAWGRQRHFVFSWHRCAKISGCVLLNS